MNRIVVAVDMSEPSLRAVDLAADLAARYDTELVLLTVGHEISGPDPGMEAYARLEHIQDPVPNIAIASMREGLVGARDRAAAKGGSVCWCHFVMAMRNTLACLSALARRCFSVSNLRTRWSAFSVMFMPAPYLLRFAQARTDEIANGRFPGFEG